MNPDEHDYDGAQSDIALGVGALLRQARERKDLSFEFVHNDTRLPIAKLKLIEEDAFEDLGGPVFVKGYIRSYAKALGLDGDALVALYQAELHAEQALSAQLAQAESSVDLETKKPSIFLDLLTPKLAMFGAAAFGVVVLALAISLVNGKGEHPDDIYPDELESASNAVQEELSPGSNVLTESGLKSSDHAAPASDPAETVLRSNVDTAELDQAEGANKVLDSAEELASDVIGLDLDQVESPEVSSVTGSISSDSEILQALPGVNEQSVSIPDSQNPLNSSLAANSSQLDMAFGEECWVEVRDAKDEVIFADLQNTGDNLRLFGQAPFNIMFGNVRALRQLAINERPIDVSPRANQKTLRLQVGLQVASAE